MTAAAIISLAATEVVVKSVRVVLWIAVPLEIETPLVLIELLEVGMAVPVPTFQNAIVTVPESTSRFQACIVQAKGTVMYCTSEVVSAEELVGSPIVKLIPWGKPVAPWLN